MTDLAHTDGRTEVKHDHQDAPGWSLFYLSGGRTFLSEMTSWPPS